MKQATPMGSHFFRPELLMEPLTVYPVCAAKIRDLFYSLLFFRFISHETEKGSGKKPEPLIFLVRPARFERATLGLEDRCSIQLSYGCEKWSEQQDLNLRPPAPKAGALPN